MKSTTQEIKKPNLYLPVLLAFIFGDIICDNYIFRTFNSQSHAKEFFLFFSMLILQIIASPIQATFSDLYCRKKSLLISLFFSLLALALVFLYNKQILFYFPILIIIILIKGSAGNTIPLSWAAVADTQEKNFRFSFGLSTASFAVGYLLLVYANKYLKEWEANLIAVSLFLILLFLCAKFFRDIRDKKNEGMNAKENGTYKVVEKTSSIHLILREIKSIIDSLKHKSIRNALSAFLLWEISLYSIVLLYVDFNVIKFSSTAISMQFGYLTGVLLLKFLEKIEDKKMIKLGYNFSSLSLIPFFIVLPFVKEINFLLLAGCYFFHTLGNAILSATLFALLAKETPPHEQGKIYGLIDSTDTIAFLIASIAIMIYNFSHANLLFIIILSYITVTISWWPYARFEKFRLKKL